MAPCGHFQRGRDSNAATPFGARYRLAKVLAARGNFESLHRYLLSVFLLAQVHTFQPRGYLTQRNYAAQAISSPPRETDYINMNGILLSDRQCRLERNHQGTLTCPVLHFLDRQMDANLGSLSREIDRFNRAAVGVDERLADGEP